MCLLVYLGLILTYAPPLRRFEHDFVTIAGLTLSDPARGPLRAGSWVSLRHKIARRPTGPVSFGHFSLRVQRKVTRVQGGAPARGRRGWSPLACDVIYLFSNFLFKRPLINLMVDGAELRG